MVIVGLLLFAANIVLGIVMLNQSKAMMTMMIHKNMLDISNTAADFLDGDVMAALTEEDVGTPVFRDIADKLTVFQNNADIEFIYAVKEDYPGHYVFTVDPDPVDPGDFGEEIVITQALIDAADGVASVPRRTAGAISTAPTAPSSTPPGRSRAWSGSTSAPRGMTSSSRSPRSPSASFRSSRC